VTLLSSDEILLRREGAFTSEAMELMSSYDYDGELALSLEDCRALSERLRVGMSIITFNADRLRSYCYYFLKLQHRYRKNILMQPNVALAEPTLTSSRMALALEFFLQMDGNAACLL
jgi:hypothetical protein